MNPLAGLLPGDGPGGDARAEDRLAKALHAGWHDRPEMCEHPDHWQDWVPNARHILDAYPSLFDIEVEP